MIIFGLTAGETAARLLGLFAFLMMDGIAQLIGANLAISGVVGVLFFVPYYKLGRTVFENAQTFGDLFKVC